MQKDMLRLYHPLVIFTFFISVTVLSMCSLNPVFTSISLISGIIYFILLRGISDFLRSLPFYLFTLIFFALINGFFNPRGLTLLFYIGNTPVTCESILRGLLSGGIIIDLLVWFSCYNEVMTSDKFISLFSRIAPTSAMTVSMVLRYIPDTIKAAHETGIYQKVIAGEKKITMTEKLRQEIRKATVVMSSSMENSIETAISMNSRGYRADRTCDICRKIYISDIVMLAVLILLIIPSGYSLFTVANTMKFYPLIKFPKISIYNYLAFTLLCFTPVILRVKEKISWLF